VTASRMLLLATTLSLARACPHPLCSQAAAEAASAPVVLDVMNYHVTMGRRIPSVYVRVFSDRTVECDPLQGPREPGAVKKMMLEEEEFRNLLPAVENTNYLGANQNYSLTHMVVDSWMQWDIKIPRTTGEQEISIADFASTPLLSGTWPIEVEKLGCSIARLRNEVYGDEREYRLSNCKFAFGPK
jgi:hypothetical protein